MMNEQAVADQQNKMMATLTKFKQQQEQLTHREELEDKFQVEDDIEDDLEDYFAKQIL